MGKKVWAGGEIPKKPGTISGTIDHPLVYIASWDVSHQEELASLLCSALLL